MCDVVHSTRIIRNVSSAEIRIFRDICPSPLWTTGFCYCYRGYLALLISFVFFALCFCLCVYVCVRLYGQLLEPFCPMEHF